jgi:hypothetical protein
MAAQGYTPPGGNVAFPTPAGIPQPPARQGSGGGGRGVLLATAGLIGVASIVAIVFAVRGHGSGSAVMFDAGDIPVSPAQTTLTADPSVASATAPPADTGGAIPGLNAGGGGGGGTPHPAPHPTKPGEPPTKPGSEPPNTPPNTPPAPPNPPKPKYDGPECQTAHRLKALGHAKEAQSFALACIAKGGDPN